MRRKKHVKIIELPKEDPVVKTYEIPRPIGIPIEMPIRVPVEVPVNIPEKKKEKK